MLSVVGSRHKHWWEKQNPEDLEAGLYIPTWGWLQGCSVAVRGVSGDYVNLFLNLMYAYQLLLREDDFIFLLCFWPLQ